MHTQNHRLLSAVPGTARQIHSFHYGPADAPGKVYIQASLHADELPGMLDRLDSVCFAAPIFFHLVRYWWT